ncbi:hypothetical protein [Mycobacterium sp.]|uniref:hypothetical protein n=1 Tax=Mycobacterium sp. TaxID=1785 RepID=UPI003C738C7B
MGDPRTGPCTYAELRAWLESDEATSRRLLCTLRARRKWSSAILMSWSRAGGPSRWCYGDAYDP